VAFLSPFRKILLVDLVGIVTIYPPVVISAVAVYGKMPELLYLVLFLLVR